MHINILFFIIYTIFKIIMIITPLIGCVAYFTYFERKIIAYMHDRVGPYYVGTKGIFQPIADAIKLLFKELILPEKSDKIIYTISPVISLSCSLLSWSVIPFDNEFMFTNINISLLFLLMIASIGVYGIILAGWSSNSKYAIISALRSVAQTISYEISISFCFVGVLILSKSINLKNIIISQGGDITNWYFFPLLPLFIIYWISALAETNRAPFDVVEGESEIVAGFHVEYSGIKFALFFLAEYSNMILVSVLGVILFFGGWLSPFNTEEYDSFWWLFSKAIALMFSFLWFRATFPRYRYDQIMRLNWKIFIPFTMFWIFIEIIIIKLI